MPLVSFPWYTIESQYKYPLLEDGRKASSCYYYCHSSPSTRKLIKCRVFLSEVDHSRLSSSPLDWQQAKVEFIPNTLNALYLVFTIAGDKVSCLLPTGAKDVINSVKLKASFVLSEERLERISKELNNKHDVVFCRRYIDKLGGSFKTHLNTLGQEWSILYSDIFKPVFANTIKYLKELPGCDTFRLVPMYLACIANSKPSTKIDPMEVFTSVSPNFCGILRSLENLKCKAMTQKSLDEIFTIILQENGDIDTRTTFLLSNNQSKSTASPLTNMNQQQVVSNSALVSITSPNEQGTIAPTVVSNSQLVTGNINQSTVIRKPAKPIYKILKVIKNPKYKNIKAIQPKVSKGLVLSPGFQCTPGTSSDPLAPKTRHPSQEEMNVETSEKLLADKLHAVNQLPSTVNQQDSGSAPEEVSSHESSPDLPETKFACPYESCGPPFQDEQREIKISNLPMHLFKQHLNFNVRNHMSLERMRNNCAADGSFCFVNDCNFPLFLNDEVLLQHYALHHG